MSLYAYIGMCKGRGFISCTNINVFDEKDFCFDFCVCVGVDGYSFFYSTRKNFSLVPRQCTTWWCLNFFYSIYLPKYSLLIKDAILKSLLINSWLLDTIIFRVAYLLIALFGKRSKGSSVENQIKIQAIKQRKLHLRYHLFKKQTLCSFVHVNYTVAVLALGQEYV